MVPMCRSIYVDYAINIGDNTKEKVHVFACFLQINIYLCSHIADMKERQKTNKTAMNIRNLFRKQLRLVIEWKEQNMNILFHQLDTPTNEIKNASKLIVAPGQGCLIVYDGKVMDTLTEPGIYPLQTDNHPFITTLLNVAQQAESEHKMRFYFFRTAELVNVLWGTASPVKYEEPHYHFPVTLGACGNFSVQIADAATMFSTLLGTVSDYTAQDVQRLVSSRIVAPLTSYLAAKAFSYTEIDSHLLEISFVLKERTAEELMRLGLTLTDFRIDATTFDNETLTRINKIANMTAEKQAAQEVDLDYVGVQKLAALRDAASNEGGLAGAGLQLSAGAQLGKDVFSDIREKKDAAPIQEGDAGTRLQKLKQWHADGLINDEEYNQKKQEILSQI